MGGLIIASQGENEIALLNHTGHFTEVDRQHIAMCEHFVC